MVSVVGHVLCDKIYYLYDQALVRVSGEVEGGQAYHGH